MTDDGNNPRHGAACPRDGLTKPDSITPCTCGLSAMLDNDAERQARWRNTVLDTRWEAVCQAWEFFANTVAAYRQQRET